MTLWYFRFSRWNHAACVCVKGQRRVSVFSDQPKTKIIQQQTYSHIRLSLNTPPDCKIHCSENLTFSFTNCFCAFTQVQIQLGSAVSSGDRGSTRARTQVETPPESLYSCRAGQSQHWWIVLEAASYMFPAGHRVPGDTTFSANNHINKHELFFTLLVRKDKWNPPRFKIKAEKWNSLGGGSVSVCAAVCHRHSVRTRLGAITTRQQHVNKEDDWSACAFVFHANQPADAAALRFVPRKQTEQHHCQHHARSWHLSSNQYYCLLSSASAHLLKVALRAGAGPTVRKPHRIRKSKVGVGLTGSRDRWEDVGHWSHDSQTSLLMSPHIKLLPHGPSLDQHQQI